MRNILALVLATCLLAGCGAEPTPTPDVVATQIAVEKAAHATMTAEAPTATNTPSPTSTDTPSPTSTDTPTPTVTPTSTPTPTHTPSPTATSTQTATATETETPKPTRKPKPTKKPTPANTPVPAVSVWYDEFHYECQKKHWGSSDPVWGYRSFQTMMYITNNSDTTLEAPWKPSRWIIANWRNPQEERITTSVWEWVDKHRNFYPEPAIGPGGKARWTYMAFPVHRWEYVKAAEFDRWGETYRFDFPRPEYPGEYNMWDCGEYFGHNKPDWRNLADWTVPTP